MATPSKEGSADEESEMAAPSNDDGRKEKERAYYFEALRSHRIRFDDAIDPDAERVKNPRKTDILFGRGRSLQKHPGNIRMREVIEKYKPVYHARKKQEKRELAEKIFYELVDEGARFLKKLEDDDAWVKVDDFIAHQKVLNVLRCYKDPDKPAKAETSDTVKDASALGYTSALRPSASTSVSIHQSGIGAGQSAGPNSAALRLHGYGTSGLTPRMGSALGSLSRSSFRALGGLSPHIGQTGMLPVNSLASNPALSLGMLQSPSMMYQLEAQRLAGLGGHLRSVASSAPDVSRANSLLPPATALAGLGGHLRSVASSAPDVSRANSLLPPATALDTFDQLYLLRRQQLVRDLTLRRHMEDGNPATRDQSGASNLLSIWNTPSKNSTESSVKEEKGPD